MGDCGAECYAPPPVRVYAPPGDEAAGLVMMMGWVRWIALAICVAGALWAGATMWRRRSGGGELAGSAPGLLLASVLGAFLVPFAPAMARWVAGGGETGPATMVALGSRGALYCPVGMVTEDWARCRVVLDAKRVRRGEEVYVAHATYGYSGDDYRVHEGWFHDDLLWKAEGLPWPEYPRPEGYPPGAVIVRYCAAPTTCGWYDEETSMPPEALRRVLVMTGGVSGHWLDPADVTPH